MILPTDIDAQIQAAAMTPTPTAIFHASTEVTARRRRYCRSILHRYITETRTMTDTDLAAVQAMLDRLGRPSRHSKDRTRRQLLRLAASVDHLADPKLAHLAYVISRCEGNLKGTTS